jgi:hypothetical protein
MVNHHWKTTTLWNNSTFASYHSANGSDDPLDLLRQQDNSADDAISPRDRSASHGWERRATLIGHEVRSRRLGGRQKGQAKGAGKRQAKGRQKAGKRQAKGRQKAGKRQAKGRQKGTF